jgi:prepilin-type N-terminal cleavage/methylation domain-containing protein
MSTKRGVTLTELLVVMSIIMILIAAAAPKLRPALEARRTREAARALNAYFGSARNAAMSTGRACGVRIDRFVASGGTSGSPFAMNLCQVSVPPSYGGDTTTSAATISVSGNTITATFTTGAYSIPANQLTGGQFQFNNQGPLYNITGNAALSLTCTADTSLGQLLQTSWPTGGVPYRIFRPPMKNAAAPLALPNSVAIDLQYSGVDNGATTWGTASTWANGSQPVTVMFSPNGNVDRIIDDNGSYPVLGTIYFLVGKRELVENFPNTLPNNGTDLNNQWIAINPQTGLVTTAEMAVSAANNPIEQRQFAAQAENMGGR